MDDILFRHTAVATPNDKSDEFLSRANASESSQKLVHDAKAFDRLLEDTLDVEVPDDLTDKILLEQSFALEHDKNITARWHIAIAASIAFILGLSLPVMNSLIHSAPDGVDVAVAQPVDNTVYDIGTVALEHVKNEYFLTAKANEKASLQSVNAKLAVYGGTAKEGLGEVLFVNYCSFKGISALHMVLNGERGRVNVFVVPDNAGFKPASSFSTEHLKGISKNVGKADVVIVGEADEPLEMMTEKLDESITWNI